MTDCEKSPRLRALDHAPQRMSGESRRWGELDRPHEAEPAHLADDLEALCERPRQLQQQRTHALRSRHSCSRSTRVASPARLPPRGRFRRTSSRGAPRAPSRRRRSRTPCARRAPRRSERALRRAPSRGRSCPARGPSARARGSGRCDRARSAPRRTRTACLRRGTAAARRKIALGRQVHPFPCTGSTTNAATSPCCSSRPSASRSP